MSASSAPAPPESQQPKDKTMKTETSTKHTPGPWACPQGLEIIAADGRVITFIDDGEYDDPSEAEANAKLIAAAPDLLSACQEFVRKVEAGEARSKRSYAEMKAAITKAQPTPNPPPTQPTP